MAEDSGLTLDIKMAWLSSADWQAIIDKIRSLAGRTDIRFDELTDICRAADCAIEIASRAGLQEHLKPDSSN